MKNIISLFGLYLLLKLFLLSNLRKYHSTKVALHDLQFKIMLVCLALGFGAVATFPLHLSQLFSDWLVLPNRESEQQQRGS